MTILNINNLFPGYDLQLPPWLCKAYVRAAPEIHINKMQAILSRKSNAPLNHTTEKEVK